MKIVLFITLIFCLLKTGAQIAFRGTNTAKTSDRCLVRYEYKKFNYTTHYCCDSDRSGIRKKVQERQLCCNGNLPNGTNVKCCNTRQLSAVSLKIAACCDIVLYNVDIEFCYNETIYSLISSTGKPVRSTVKIQSWNKPRDVSGSNRFLIIVVGCSVFSCLSLTAIFSCHSTCNYKRYIRLRHSAAVNSSGIDMMKRNKEKNAKGTFQQTPAGNSLLDVVEIDGFENTEDYVIPSSNKRLTHSRNMLDDITTGDVDNIVTASMTSNKPTQTENNKIPNVRNIMGKQFDAAFVFDKSNKSLVLPHSAAKLTLSEEDVTQGPIQCYASTHRNLNEIYDIFKKYLKKDEEIVSPTIEYLFPGNKRLHNFASVDMDYHNCGCNKRIDVWRFECDICHGGITHRERIPSKETVEIKNADAFYEIISPSKIRIYLKRFCTLVCTVCHGEHESLSLAAQADTLTLPNNSATKQHIRVNLYILAGVSQLPDYNHILYQHLNADEQPKHSLQKKINLPRRVQLEDNIAIRLKLLLDSTDIWQQVALDEYLDSIEKVQLHNIVSCPRYNTNGLPYSKEWLFENAPMLNVQIMEKLVFECAISIRMEHPYPGVDTRTPPPTSLSVIHEVNLTGVKTQVPQTGGGMQSAHLPEQHSRATNDGRLTDVNSRMPLRPNPNEGTHFGTHDRYGPTAVPVRSGASNLNASTYQLLEDRVNTEKNTKQNTQNPTDLGARPKERPHHHRADVMNRERRDDNLGANEGDILRPLVRAENSDDSLFGD